MRLFSDFCSSRQCAYFLTFVTRAIVPIFLSLCLARMRLFSDLCSTANAPICKHMQLRHFLCANPFQCISARKMIPNLFCIKTLKYKVRFFELTRRHRLNSTTTSYVHSPPARFVEKTFFSIWKTFLQLLFFLHQCASTVSNIFTCSMSVLRFANAPTFWQFAMGALELKVAIMLSSAAYIVIVKTVDYTHQYRGICGLFYTVHCK